MIRRAVSLLLSFLGPIVCQAQTLDEVFQNPPQEARPLMIWQWMDGVVSSEGITADLEAYREAGIGGVQQFLVGGPVQAIIRDTTNAIGTDNWRQLMRHALGECQRLGLTFGTHNCPGWSSSAFPTVPPEVSMQKLVWSEQIVAPVAKDSQIPLPEQPEVDAQWNYYRDIAVLVMPADSLVRLADIRVLQPSDFPLLQEKGGVTLRVLRVGHTTNGKTNGSTAPTGGVGLECDKMSRKAVLSYWQGYPQMLLDLSRTSLGTTFQRIEIDSYEAGGQEWTPLMPEEFQKRCHYDMLPWLPVLKGLTVESAEGSRKFNRDYATVGQQLFTENYYGYMAELAHQNGLKLLYEPYGTNSSKPFNPINTEAIARLLPDDYFCTEFWTQPTSWGWPSLPRHMQAAHKAGARLIFAEGFTHWPRGAWQEDPASQKVLADKAFCLGVNALMLHAGAQNPWTNVLPGMTFGQWGSWWTPGQTWWRSGAAKLLFQYMARCQALLQRGEWVEDFSSKGTSLKCDQVELQWTRRRDGDADIYFLSNPLDSAFTAVMKIASTARLPELWLPDTGLQTRDVLCRCSDGSVELALHFDEYQSCFIVLREPFDSEALRMRNEAFAAALQQGLMLMPTETSSLPVEGPWTLHFPEGWDAPAEVTLDGLTPWNEHQDDGIRYFSGTATYEKTISMKRIDRKASYVLDLGVVKNLAQVTLNGQPVAHLWKKPFRCDVTPYLKKGDNKLQIAVTNLWPNRMIGDEQWPDDLEWGNDDPSSRPIAGMFLRNVPDWLRLGQPRPSEHRKTVVSTKFFSKDSPLLPSGLLGPVKISVFERGSKK